VVGVTSKGRCWTVRRTLADFVFLDRVCHKSVFDRRVSKLPEIPADALQEEGKENVEVNVDKQVGRTRFFSPVGVTFALTFCSLPFFAQGSSENYAGKGESSTPAKRTPTPPFLHCATHSPPPSCLPPQSVLGRRFERTAPFSEQKRYFPSPLSTVK